MIYFKMCKTTLPIFIILKLNHFYRFYHIYGHNKVLKETLMEL